MSHSLENVAKTLGAGLDRRDALKAVVGAVAGVAAAGAFGRTVSASPIAQGLTGNHHREAFALRVAMPTGHNMLLWLTDKHVGRASYKGQTISFVPHMQGKRQVEVALYRGAVSDTQFVRRVVLPIHDVKFASDASPVPVNVDFMPKLALAAVWTRQVEMMPDFDPEADCSVSCCYGGSGSGCAVCCDAKDPSCGECCDGGCCPGCS